MSLTFTGRNFRQSSRHYGPAYPDTVLLLTPCVSVKLCFRDVWWPVWPCFRSDRTCFSDETWSVSCFSAIKFWTFEVRLGSSGASAFWTFVIFDCESQSNCCRVYPVWNLQHFQPSNLQLYWGNSIFEVHPLKCLFLFLFQHQVTRTLRWTIDYLTDRQKPINLSSTWHMTQSSLCL